MRPTILITGCSKGIGMATANYFHSKGWNVAATMRNPQKNHPLNALEHTTIFPLDVTRQESISLAVNSIINHFGQIDVVVNNAGYGAMGPFEAAEPEQIQKQINTNIMGVMMVTQEIIPIFRTQKSGIVINVSSVGGRMTFPLYSIYNASKWAVEGFSEALTYELRPFNIQIKIIEPGPIHTDFYSHSMDPLIKEELTDYDHYVRNTFHNFKNMGTSGAHPNQVATAIFRAATDGRKKMRYPVGGHAPSILFLRWLIPTRWFNTCVAWILEKRSATKQG